MQFLHTDLGYLSGGEIVEVTLDSRANVRLMDSSNFSSYRAGRRHNFYGGQAKQSPVRIPVPRSGHWHLAIDLGGYSGRIRSSVRVLPGALPPIRNIPLSDVPSLVHEPETPPIREIDSEATYDVFISHASEDKSELVRPLAEALRNEGLSVWYDEFELRIGDSLRRKIDAGLARSRFGVVVLSPSFFEKGWTNYELDGLVTRSVSGDQILLPIWHKVTKAEVVSYSPSLADKVARSTAVSTPEEIAVEIADVIRSHVT
jgi:hypothetical protein